VVRCKYSTLGQPELLRNKVLFRSDFM
jgi:hypothetical protein